MSNKNSMVNKRALPNVGHGNGRMETLWKGTWAPPPPTLTHRLKIARRVVNQPMPVVSNAWREDVTAAARTSISHLQPSGVASER